MLPIKNKGMFLEEILNLTNQKYLEEKRCFVTKVPTSLKVIKKQNQTKIAYQENFNCDYIGCYQGQYFEFEAKETDLETFSFHNLRKNQIAKLDLIVQNQGIGFVIIYFNYYNRYFLVNWSTFQQANFKNKKTIPLEWFIDNSFELFIQHNLILDYLPIINRLTNYTL